MACLAALCEVLPGRVAWGEKELRWPTLAEVIETKDNGQGTMDNLVDTITEPIDTIIPVDTVVSVATSTPMLASTPKPVIPKVAVDSVTDSRIFLAAFYEALDHADGQMIRVLHYGDSQIEEDRMSQQIREKLQAQYGGRGAGLLPLAQTIPSRTVRQELWMNERKITPAQGPRRYLVYGPKRDQRTDGMYGVMGQVAVMNDSLVKGSEAITAACTPLDGRPRYTQWKVFADTSIHYSFAGDTVCLNGKGKVYGLSQQSSTGVIVDNIPMRGCLGLVFTKMDRELLTRFYREQNVRLIIMQFGGNAIPSNQTRALYKVSSKGYANKCVTSANVRLTPLSCSSVRAICSRRPTANGILIRWYPIWTDCYARWLSKRISLISVCSAGWAEQVVWRGGRKWD